MVTSVLAALALAQQRGPSELFREFLARSTAEVRRRRTDLVPFASRKTGIPPEERKQVLRQFLSAWTKGRYTEAVAVLRRAAKRAGRFDGEIVRTYAQVLARTGDWAEARDLIGVNLPSDPEPFGTLEPMLFAVASVEAGALEAGLYTFCGAVIARMWNVPESELARLYPADASGLRRVAWAVYATASIEFDTVGRHEFRAKGDAEELNARWARGEKVDLLEVEVPLDLHQTQWATAEAFRHYPDDPVAAYWASFEGRFRRDRSIIVRTAGLRKEVDRRRKVLAPALQRLRSSDKLYELLQSRLVYPVPTTADRTDGSPKPSTGG